MPRKSIPLVAGETYHVFNRGVDKRIIFFDSNDYLRFYNSLNHFNNTEPVFSLFESIRMKGRLNSKKKLVKIFAYCSLPNHFHLLLQQVSDNGISEFLKKVTGGYTSYFNDKYERSGALFQGRFKRIQVPSNEKLLQLSAYINYNHLVHELNDGEQLYKSSREIYSGNKQNNFIDSNFILKQYNSKQEYVESAFTLAKNIAETRKIEKRDEKENLYNE